MLRHRAAQPAQGRPQHVVSRVLRLSCLSLLSGLALAACATTPKPRPVPPRHRYPPRTGAPPSRYAPAATPAPTGQLVPLEDMRGWAEEDYTAALAAYRLGCGLATDPAARAACARARALGVVNAEVARRFFETNFRVELRREQGLLTAYFAPEYPARHTQDEEFSAAVRPIPDDMALIDPQGKTAQGRKLARLNLDGALAPYPDRTAIELLPPVRALAWMRPEDLFFMQIQGSGGLVFPDGERVKALYAADNGQPFVAIAPEMARRGLLPPNLVSGDRIRRWLGEHRGPEAQAIMDLDPRYIFFKLAPDDGADPVGGAGLPLPAGRAIAIDNSVHAYGELYWLDATAPILTGAMKRYRRLVMTLDTGSAIRGDVRADLYMGRGPEAGSEAGRVRHQLLLMRLVPLAQPTNAYPALRPPLSGEQDRDETPPSP